jgi:hypothetical protein
VRSSQLNPEIRYRDASGDVHMEKAAPLPPVRQVGFSQAPTGTRRLSSNEPSTQPQPRVVATMTENPDRSEMRGLSLQPVRVYPYGVARNRLMQSAKRLGVPAIVVRELSEADTLITLRAYYRGRQQTILEAEQRGMPIYVLRANTNNQIEQLLAELFNLSYHPNNPENVEEQTSQTQAAIELVMNGERYVDLAPASAAIRRMQHEMARQAQLTSHSFGKEPNRRVRIYRE